MSLGATPHAAQRRSKRTTTTTSTSSATEARGSDAIYSERLEFSSSSPAAAYTPSVRSSSSRLSQSQMIPSPDLKESTRRGKRHSESLIELPPEHTLTRRVLEYGRFPILVLSSYIISALGYSVSAPFSTHELAGVSRRPQEDVAVIIALAFKAIELAGGYYAHYDYMDISSLTALTHIPYYYLLSTFYNISYPTLITAFSIDIASTFLPFYFFRPISRAHDSRNPLTSILSGQFVLTSVLAASVYSVIVLASFYTWLPVYLVVHFDGLRNLDSAHGAAFPNLVAAFVPLGLAARAFFFSPAVSIAHPHATRDPRFVGHETHQFDPETATLKETLWWNIWGWERRTKVLIERAFMMALMTIEISGIRTYLTIEGTEFWGSLGWSAVWAVAGMVCAGILGWVGDV